MQNNQGEIQLRAEIERGISESGMTLSEFSVYTGINRGIFSAMFKAGSPKPISLNQLERIAQGLGKPEGWMFESYVEECFFGGKPNRRRVEPFLIRCAELGKIDCIEEVLNRLIEDPRQIDQIFEWAEQLYIQGYMEQSMVFYRRVVKHEKYHQSERLAISQYRIFLASVGEDNEQNLCAAIEFEPFCDKLPDRYRIDAIMRLFDVYFMLEKIGKADYYALELHEFAQKLYDLQEAYAHRNGTYPELELFKPLVVYYGYSYLGRGSVLFRKGRFHEALSCNEGYADLSWFPNQNEEARIQIARFAKYARQNEVHIKLLIGQDIQETILRCVEILEQDPAETLVSLFFLLRAADLHGLDITSILDRFEQQFAEALGEQASYPRHHLLNRYEGVCFEMARYFFARDQWDKAYDRLLCGLNVAIAINDREMFAKCIPLFEKYRRFAGETHLRHYGELLENVKCGC